MLVSRLSLLLRGRTNVRSNLILCFAVAPGRMPVLFLVLLAAPFTRAVTVPRSILWLCMHAFLVSRIFECRMLIACDNVSEAYKAWYTVHKTGDCFNSITCSLFKAAVSGVIPFELSAPRSKLWYSPVHRYPIVVL
jgi:hypothetical protein